MAVDVTLKDLNGWERGHVALPFVLGYGAYADLQFVHALDAVANTANGDSSAVPAELDRNAVLATFPRLCSIDPYGEVEFDAVDFGQILDEIAELMPYLSGLAAGLYGVLAALIACASEEPGLRIVATGD